MRDPTGQRGYYQISYRLLGDQSTRVSHTTTAYHAPLELCHDRYAELPALPGLDS
jgi:hypothetical protein